MDDENSLIAQRREKLATLQDRGVNPFGHAYETSGTIAEVREKFGVDPVLIPDYLALVGDAADGYPGIPGIGATTAAQLLNRHGAIEDFPPDVLRGDKRALALLFKNLATLRTDAPLFSDVDELRWRGPSSEFDAFAKRMGDERLLGRALKASAALPGNSLAP